VWPPFLLLSFVEIVRWAVPKSRTKFLRINSVSEEFKGPNSWKSNEKIIISIYSDPLFEDVSSHDLRTQNLKSSEAGAAFYSGRRTPLRTLEVEPSLESNLEVITDQTSKSYGFYWITVSKKINYLQVKLVVKLAEHCGMFICNGYSVVMFFVFLLNKEVFRNSVCPLSSRIHCTYKHSTLWKLHHNEIE
jgi:hypothetical protein